MQNPIELTVATAVQAMAVVSARGDRTGATPASRAKWASLLKNSAPAVCPDQDRGVRGPQPVSASISGDARGPASGAFTAHVAAFRDFWQQTASLCGMAIVDRKQQLFENVARLRRVGRLVPDNEDLFAVRLGLEQELGETISRRLAAKLLGVSHTALERWIESGDVPLVFTAAGRQEVSVAALLDLYESVRSSKTGGTIRHPLAAAFRSRQHAAERLSVDWPHDRKGGSYDRTHLRGLAYHQAVAGRMRKQTVADAKYVLYRWREQGRIDPVYAERWDRVLAMPLTAIRDAITAAGADADDLRQNSPFAGALTEPERRRVLVGVG
jgi:hypothetical protein